MSWEIGGSTYALPLDVFRILVGVLSLAWFARTWREAPLFSGPDGLLDHDLERRLLPFTRLGLFPPGASLNLLRLAYVAGGIASLLLAVGIAPQAAALVAYVLAVSTYRWNLLLMYVDDAIVHLALFWMVVLPIGHTLTLFELIAEPSVKWTEWQAVAVPDLAVRCFMANLALVYLVAGLWKWTSPMWRKGWAVYAVLKMAVAYRPSTWRPSAWLRLGNWFALIVEPALALLPVLPAGIGPKWWLFVGAVAFHGGIVATLKFPFANLAMLGACVVFFGSELMSWLGAPRLVASTMPITAADWLAVGTVASLAGMCLLNATWFSGHSTLLWRSPAHGRQRLNPFYVPLWIIGLAQSYRLFDWIDERNYHVSYEVLATTSDGDCERIDERTFFGSSMRHVLLQSYLYGNLWVRIDPDSLPELRASILTRYARRFLRTRRATVNVDIHVIVRRISLDNLDLRRGTRVHLLQFANDRGEPRVSHMCLAPPAFV